MRRVWRIARPHQATPPSACAGGKPRFLLALRNFSSSLSEAGARSSDGSDNTDAVKEEAARSEREETNLAALRTFKDLNGHLLVPTRFVIPHGDKRWPSVMWGHKLGRAVSDLRSKFQSLSTGMEEELESLGFVRNPSQFKWDNITLPALQQFHTVHGHADVPFDFVVPTGDEAWPKLTWGHRLGSMVVTIRHHKVYSTQVAMSKEELDRMGFCYAMAIAERDWMEKILPSIRVYRQVFGDCIIPYPCIVPSCTPWPEQAWGMPLGVAVRDIRVGKTYVDQVARDKDVLDSVGFAWNRDAAMWNDVIIPSLETYVDIFGGGKIPQKFVVPSEVPWPECAWGKNLGSILRDLRSKGTYFGFYGRDIEKLGELGLNHKLSSRAWTERVAPLLDLFMELHGEEEVPHDFVIPSETPWDEKMWGVRLGLIVARNPQFTPRKC